MKLTPGQIEIVAHKIKRLDDAESDLNEWEEVRSRLQSLSDETEASLATALEEVDAWVQTRELLIRTREGREFFVFESDGDFCLGTVRDGEIYDGEPISDSEWNNLPRPIQIVKDLATELLRLVSKLEDGATEINDLQEIVRQRKKDVHSVLEDINRSGVFRVSDTQAIKIRRDIGALRYDFELVPAI